MESIIAGFFFNVFHHSFCCCCLGDEGICEVLSLLSSSLSRYHSCFQEYLLQGGMFFGHRQLLKVIWFKSVGISIFRKGEILHSPVRSSSLQNRSSCFLISSGNHRNPHLIYLGHRLIYIASKNYRKRLNVLLCFPVSFLLNSFF